MDKRRNGRAYARSAPVREPYEAVLIVCEGEKTEPHYFSRLRVLHRLSSANVEILSALGTDPMSIVSYANDRETGGEYDKIFCVFDRNGHSNYDEALNKITNSAAGKAKRLVPITSWPCFEFWVLLHFQYSTASFVKSRNKSSCDMVIREVRKHFPQYTKGHKSIYDDLLPNQAEAITRASRLSDENCRTGSKNPATMVHGLVSYLLDLKANKTRDGNEENI
jgi:hypothetical protein